MRRFFPNWWLQKYTFSHIFLHTTAIFIGNWCSLSNQIELWRKFSIHVSQSKRFEFCTPKHVFHSIFLFEGEIYLSRLVLDPSKGALFAFITHSLFISSKYWNDSPLFVVVFFVLSHFNDTFVTFITLNYGSTLRIDCCRFRHSIHTTHFILIQ